MITDKRILGKLLIIVINTNQQPKHVYDITTYCFEIYSVQP